MTAAPHVWTFDRLEPGQELGRLEMPLDDERLGRWEAIYGAGGPAARVPSGLLVATMMEAYLRAFQPRPSGNIHAGQVLRFGCGAAAGDRLDAEVRCLDKELRNERRWVTFGVTLRNGARDVLRGEMRVIWAS